MALVVAVSQPSFWVDWTWTAGQSLFSTTAVGASTYIPEGEYSIRTSSSYCHPGARSRFDAAEFMLRQRHDGCSDVRERVRRDVRSHPRQHLGPRRAPGRA